MYAKTTVAGASIIYTVVNLAKHDVYAKMATGKTVKQIGENEKALVAMNFNFANNDIGLPIGRIIENGKIVNHDIEKTAPRHELYMTADGQFKVGKAPAGSLWAVQGSPVVLFDGKKVIGDSVKRDQTPNDIANSSNYRAALGVRKNNELIMIRTVSKVTLDTLANIFLALDCIHGINGDGGGSTYLWPYDNGWGRLMGSALVVKEKRVDVTPPPKEEINMQKPVIIEDFIPKGRGNRPGYNLVAEYITVHDTANKAATADADNHAKYLKGDDAAAKPVSWHFTVDDKKIIQHLPINENGWAAGDGSNGTGNRKSIQIELCENAGVDRAKVEANAIKLIAYLLELLNKPTSIVVQHNKWTGKNCPASLRTGTKWATFIAQIDAARKASDPLPNETKPVVVVEGFTDLHGHWGQGPMVKGIKAGLIVGTAPGISAPDGTLTRAQLMTILDRAGILDELLKKKGLI